MPPRAEAFPGELIFRRFKLHFMPVNADIRKVSRRKARRSNLVSLERVCSDRTRLLIENIMVMSLPSTGASTGMGGEIGQDTSLNIFAHRKSGEAPLRWRRA